MVLLTTVTSATAQIPPNVTETTSPSSDVDSLDKGVVSGVIAAVFLTLLLVLALITCYMYRHKGSYRTNEPEEEAEEEEARKALQTNMDSGEEKQEYLM
ncbi:small cell adhesion glycoprotein [Leptodactylus fuscus]|uniref:small cell adhesion glycoprotein n=1 Tax=Leptodactylus fuscus TaxID=238119 RepID=UPI003F4F225B